MKNLGKYWYQLAIAMGLSKTAVDDIEQKCGVNLEWKIISFLEFGFPAFPTDRETAEFLVEALKRASLPKIANEVKRDLGIIFNLEGIHKFSALTLCYPVIVQISSSFPVKNLIDTEHASSSNEQWYDRQWCSSNVSP